MNSIESIKSIFPKYKQQLLFLRERKAIFDDSSLVDKNKENLIVKRSVIQSSDCSSNEKIVDCWTVTNKPESSLTLAPHSFDTSANDVTSNRSPEVIIDSSSRFSSQEDYRIPSLPASLLNDIESGDLSKFNSHCKNRQILLDAIFYDLTSKFKIWYPSHQEYDIVTIAVLKLLRLPISKENMLKWREAIQTKYKKERRPNTDNVEVKMNKERYSCGHSGRPVKKKLGEVAQRDRQKQVYLVQLNPDEGNVDANAKLEGLRNQSPVDDLTLINLWRSTLDFRRKEIRNKTTQEILFQYPEYSKPVLIFEEVKLTTGLDICAAIHRQVPVLLEKFSSEPAFINDSMLKRLLKILARLLEETSHHIVNTTEATTPYPSIIITDDVLYIYVDYHLITHTSSPAEALALVLSMFSIFELAFEKNGRVLRFLYAILFGEKRYLSNTTRKLVQEKSINIYTERNLSSTNESILNKQTSPSLDNPSSTTIKTIARNTIVSVEHATKVTISPESTKQPESKEKPIPDTNMSSFASFSTTKPSTGTSDTNTSAIKRRKRATPYSDEPMVEEPADCPSTVVTEATPSEPLRRTSRTCKKPRIL